MCAVARTPPLKKPLLHFRSNGFSFSESHKLVPSMKRIRCNVGAAYVFGFWIITTMPRAHICWAPLKLGSARFVTDARTFFGLFSLQIRCCFLFFFLEICINLHLA